MQRKMKKAVIRSASEQLELEQFRLLQERR